MNRKTWHESVFESGMHVIKDKLKRALNFVEKGYLKQAEILYLQCVDVLGEGSSEYEQALHGLAYVKMDLGHFEDARDLYRKLLEIAREKGHKEREAIVYHQLGMVEQMAGQYSEARRFFQAERAVYESHHPDFYLGLAANWYEEGIMSLKERDLTSAHKHFTVSLDYAKQSGDLVAIGCAYRGLGDSWQKTGDEDKAHAYFAQAKEVFWRAGDEKAVKEVDNRLRNDQHMP